jgi:Domain of unknown function (DUF4747)
MARQRKVSASAINVRVHPHGDGRYLELFRAAFELRRSVRVRGDTHFALGSLDPSQADETGELHGQIARFTNIDPDLPWFDFDSLDEAEEDRLREIRIPESLKPNYATFGFVFNINSHVFIYEYYYRGFTLSPRQVAKFLTDLLNDERLVNRFGPVDVSIISSHEQLTFVFAIESLKKAQIIIQRPNADDFGDLEQEFEDRMNNQNASKIEITYEAVRGQSLEPDQRTKNEAAVASRNGEVLTSGRNAEGVVESRSTADHPIVQSERYDSDLLSEQTAFVRVARALLQRIRQG